MDEGVSKKRKLRDLQGESSRVSRSGSSALNLSVGAKRRRANGTLLSNPSTLNHENDATNICHGNLSPHCDSNKFKLINYEQRKLDFHQIEEDHNVTDQTSAWLKLDCDGADRELGRDQWDLNSTNPNLDQDDRHRSSGTSDRHQTSPKPSLAPGPQPESTASAVLSIELAMISQLPAAEFVGGKVTHVYNPLAYAHAPHADYVRRYVDRGARCLLVGMNPGPWGMSQTGVPFGEVAAVRDWLGVEGQVLPPAGEHPKRPVTGLLCPRSEVSGQRFWGLWRDLCGTPDRFFQNAFVYNFCPLAFMERQGKNVTPNNLRLPLRKRIEAVCGDALARVVQVLRVETVIGVGKYAEERAREALRSAQLDSVRVFPLLHPSPANPQANRDWKGVATRQLKEAGLLQLLTSSG
ncbi:single-strand selective monofunctional uracil DNA glycosylase-like isoform X1 [Pollicipes pollicipes]|uniref:single-strand selective monofunctional uracil DNA glycosylase-like isoform X1 n=1 Tax=Pollicipes pollicipes TaxID=41117 RepID=UPI00188599B9|nr:single-strand selective monofunctional uracil DNA glycosylase-like isoform X1 [Pollicipes pollicipes]